jgi:hypothetical protein
MTTPKATTAWACGHCGNLFRKNTTGKCFASACCTCTGCGATKPMYTGSISLCRRCAVKRNLASARLQTREQLKYLAEVEAEAKRLGIDLADAGSP